MKTDWSIPANPRVHPGPELGDLLLAGGVAFTVVGLRSGLNRADLFHLGAPVAILALGVLLGRRRALFRLSKSGERVALASLVLAAATYAFGLLPSASYLAAGWARGMRATVARGPSTELTFEPRAPIIETQRAEPDPDLLAMAEYLGDPARSSRPVLFYSNAWMLGKNVGVFKEDFINDDLLYSDERGELVRAYLEDRRDALVVMHRPTYERLYGLSDPDDISELRARFRPTLTKSIASWLSTVHFREIPIESQLKDRRWRRTVGDWLAARHSVAAEFGDYVVLEPTDPGG